MEPGAAIGSEYRFLNFGKRLVQLDSDGAVARPLSSLSVEGLITPQGWSRSFLLQTESGIYRAFMEPEGGLTVVALHPSPEARIHLWNQSALITAPQEPYLLSVTDTAVQSLPLAGAADLAIIDDANGLVLSDGRWYRLEQGLEVTLEALPQGVADGLERVVFGPGSALLWSEDQASFLILHPTAGALEHASNLLPERPVGGALALGQGQFLVEGAERLHWIDPGATVRSTLRPEGFSLEALDPPHIFLFRGDLRAVYRGSERLKAWRWSSGGFTEQDLGVGELASAVEPSSALTAPWLVVAERRSEDDFDRAGRAVIELSTGQPRQAPVSDLTLFGLASDGEWTEVQQWPRTQLAGPVERFGEVILLALQRDPERRSGVEQILDLRYPYPQVLLQGRRDADLSLLWEWAPERGTSPAKGRLPDRLWPKTDPAGPIYFTSEDGRLIAFSPTTGEPLWYSTALPIDDSHPLMLDWGDSLGLQMSQGPRDTLVRLDYQTGQRLAEIALNPFFLSSRWPHLIGVALICMALLYYIYAAGRRKLYIRRIAGLQALDEAVGRATEMGKPVLYVTGLADVDDIQTLAALSIMSHVARKTAEYDTPIVTTTSRAVVFSAAKEVVKDAYTIAGRPDAFSIESVRYISDDQFGYTAGVDGIMLREKPAANFYMGKFYAESLILAETGHATGAIQIAGTAEPSQLPFFVAACDYTLIGEELFAASAYLSRDPLQVGSLRGQDVGKAIVMMALVLGSLYVTLVGPLEGMFTP